MKKRLKNKKIEIEPELLIGIVGGGAIVGFDNGDSTYGHETYTYDRDNLEDFAEMLWNIAMILEPGSSRYDKQRIVIQIQHGDKYECKEKNCKICKER